MFVNIHKKYLMNVDMLKRYLVNGDNSVKIIYLLFIVIIINSYNCLQLVRYLSIIIFFFIRQK